MRVEELGELLEGFELGGCSLAWVLLGSGTGEGEGEGEGTRGRGHTRPTSRSVSRARTQRRSFVVVIAPSAAVTVR